MLVTTSRVGKSAVSGVATTRFELSKKGKLARSIALASLLVGTSLEVYAQESADPNAIEEVLVTVQRRSESVQDVPLAVSAFSGEFLRDVNLDDVKDLVAYTPGLTGNSKDSFIDTLQIRGINTYDFGVGGDPSIGFFKNGLYQGRNGSVVTSLYDIDRAEVVRGSQGFLFGRNAIAGAISVHTRRPDFDGFDAYAEITGGERNHGSFEGAVTVPLGEDFAGRLAVYKSQEDGYVENFANPGGDDLISHDKEAFRLSLRKRTDNLDINFFAEYEDREQSGSVYRAIEQGDSFEELDNIFGLALRGGPRDADSDQANGEGDDSKVASIGLQVDIDLDWATLTSSTGYKDHEYQYAEDFDGTPLRINNYSQDQEGDYFEQEIRLVSAESDSPISWYAGVSYYQEDIDTTFTQVADEEVICQYYEGVSCTAYFAQSGDVFTANAAGLVESNQVIGDYSGYAAYVDVTYKFSEKVDASFGLRYVEDNKDFSNEAFGVDSELGAFFALQFTTDGALTNSRSWDDVSPRIVVRYFPNDDWLVFANVTTGYKAGGFGSFALTPVPASGEEDVTQADAQPDPFDAETSISYELGTKGSFADGRAKLNLTAYRFSYEDLQAVVTTAGGGIRVDNVGEVDSYGIEATFQYVLNEHFDVFASAALADSEATGVQAFCGNTNDCEGSALPRLPKVSWGMVLQGTLPTNSGDWIARLEGFGQNKTYGEFGLESDFRNDRFYELALRAGYRSHSGWDAILYAENLTDEVYFDGVNASADIIPGTAFGPSRPKTIGIRLGWSLK